MELMEAIEKRISCRAFETRDIEAEKLAQLQACIDAANAEAGVNFQLYGAGCVAGQGNLELASGMFANQAPAYAALVAQDSDEGQEVVGYYGEKLVLLATQLGLGCCWVAGTYDHDSVIAEVGEGQTLHDVIPLGYVPAKMPLKQRTIRAGIRKRDRKLKDLFESSVTFQDAPAWIRAGIEAVHKGPSAVNEQPVVFVWDADAQELTCKLLPMKTGLQATDLGIAKLHFEIAAAAQGVQGTWERGAAARFVCA